MTTALFAFGYFLVFMGLVTLFIFLKRRARQDRAPFPENTRLLRGPGESLRRKVTELDEKITNSILAGLVAPALVAAIGFYLATLLLGWTQLTVASVTTITFLVTFIYMARRMIAVLDRWRNTSLGYFGERIVAEHLEPLKATGHRVFHDVPAGDPPAGSTLAPYNLDHVVVGPAGVFAIETKTRRKGRARVGFMAHEIIYDGRALAYPWGEDQHGLDQARRQADWLAAFLQKQLGQPVPVRPLLVFPGWMIIRKSAGLVTVLNPRELPPALELTRGRGTGFAVPALDPATIDLIARQLDARCRDIEL